MRAVAGIAPPLIALVLFVATWEALVRALGTPAYLLPPPSAIAQSFASGAADLVRATAVTGRAAAQGFAVSAAIGVLAAVVLSSSRVLERALYPYTVFLQTVPIVAIAPLLVLWFGPGLRAVTVSSFIVSVFPVIAGGVSGIRGVDPGLRDLFRVYGASRAAILLRLELPAAVPSLVTGLRVAGGLSVIGAIVGEFVAGFSDTESGLGIVILASYRHLETDRLFAAVLCASLLGVGLFGAVSAVGHLLLARWHPSERKP